MELVIILALAFGAMWLMTSRTRKQQREAADFRANLEVGQEVMTGSGLYGTIVEIDGDTITLESTPGSYSRWIRAAIARLAPPVDVDEAEEDAEYDDEDAAYEDADGPYDDDAAVDATDADGRWQDAEGETEVRTDHQRAGTGATTPTQPGGGSSRLDHVDVPDDASSIDERRTDGGTDRR